MSIRRMNRLIREKSPYLLQHAYNPVDWYPWGAEAFFRARSEDKPVFLSIGYSSCHWCHVMERESFENERIAEILNTYFVPVKVDREERPDVDEIYITAVQLITGSAGWPLSVFLTPDGEPFYGGTYFPPAVFAELLQQVAQLWHTRRAQVLQTAKELTEDLRHLLSLRTRELRGERDPSIFSTYLIHLMAGYDPQYGGFGDAPKFPPHTHLPNLLWMAEEWDGDEAGTNAAIMAIYTLYKMAEGGIHDHIGGGFHRYSTDRQWLVPHFEKMLNDNAQLAWCYTHLYNLSGEPEMRDVAHDTLQWMIREMLLEHGAFASALDADSPEGEGTFYTWTQEEISELGGFFETTPDHSLLIVRHKSVQDRQMPSGNAAAAQLLTQLGDLLTGDDPPRSERYQTLARDTLNAFWKLIQDIPSATGSLLGVYLALEGYTLPVPEIEEIVTLPSREGPVRVEVFTHERGLWVNFNIQEGWHIYPPQPTRPDRVPTRIEVQTDLPIQFGDPIWSSPESVALAGEQQMVYRGEAFVLFPIVAIGEGETTEGYLRVHITYQPCTETECALPVERHFVLPVRIQGSDGSP
jgi:uncharacterized protein YyaL (SSP411 family)